MIETKRLKLIQWEGVHFEALFQNDMILLGALLDSKTPKVWTTFDDAIDALPQFYEAYKNNSSHWGSFFTVHKAERMLLGTCGFKGKPTTEGVVEIGYEIMEAYRLQGLAAEAAKGLMDFAFSHPEITKVRAHTLAHENPSVSVLKKLGFQFVKEAYDPDDGDIWQWEFLKSTK